MKLVWLKKLLLMMLNIVNIFLLLMIAVGIYSVLQQQEKLGNLTALCIIIFIFSQSLKLSKKIKSSIPIQIHHTVEDDIVYNIESPNIPNNKLISTQDQATNPIMKLPIKTSQENNFSLGNVNNYQEIPYDITKLLWFYDGPNKNCYRKDEPSLIIESLPVKQGPAEPLGYYPSYQTMTPQQRFKYLSWLRDVSQIIDIGYVFTFYYGLEKHIVDGDTESAVKTIKILKQYHDNSSFQDYSNSALIYAAIKKQDINKLDGVLLDSLPREVFITLRYMFYKKLTSEDIIHSMKAIGFNNTRYIKSEYNLFNSTLNELLQKRFNSNVYNFEIPASFSFNKIKPIPLANYGLSYKVREFEIPNVLSHTPTTAELYDLLFTTHEIVKQKLKEKRKSVVQK